MKYCLTLLCILCIGCGLTQYSSPQMKYTRETILNDLEKLEGRFFPDLEHGYFHTAGNRITLFADAERWALVFEKSGFANRAYAGQIELNYFGNCLTNLETYGADEQLISNAKWIDIISADELEKIEGEFETLSEQAAVVKVRGKSIPIEHDLSKYVERGIELEPNDSGDLPITFESLIRYLDETHPELFRASNDELRLCLPKDLPLLMKIDEWHHKPYNDAMSEYHDGQIFGTPPSKYETFRLIADVLVSRDTSLWKPTLPANNNWRNWPEAGHL